MKKTGKVLISFLMLVSLTCSYWNGLETSLASDTAKPVEVKSTAPTDVPGILERNYSNRLEAWKDLPAVSEFNKAATPDLKSVASNLITTRENSFGYAADTIRWHNKSEITFEVNVEQTGLYQIAFDYTILDTSILPTEGYIKINGEYPYNEARRIVFQNLWKNNVQDVKPDRYGNELVPKPVKAAQWQTTYAYDASYFHMEPLKFKLNKGRNQITLTNTRGDMLVGEVRVESPHIIDTYADYMARLDPKMNGEEKGAIVIEGESMLYKNDSSIRAASGKNIKLTPYDGQRQLLNMLDGQSWFKGGQNVSWPFDVTKSGNYHLAFKYQQDKKYDLPAFRKIEVDGKVPFRELDNYPFPYGNSWKNETLGKGAQPYWIYLEKGSHTLRLTVNVSNYRPLVEELTATMKQISELTLEIQKLTGNKTDAYRDWSLQEYIPDADKRLLGWADRLERLYGQMGTYNPEKPNIGELVNLKLAVKQLRKLGKSPDELPNRLNLLSQGSSSVSQLLGDLLQRMMQSPLSIDRIYVYQKDKLPSTKAAFFKKIGVSVQNFFQSFGKKPYTAAKENSEELQVWVNRPRQYVELMQKLIDQQFTPQTGVSVNLSIMPDENKLVLANASGRQPDVALGVNNALPYEMSIRGAIVDLRQFQDYPQVMRAFSKGSVIPFAFEDGVYALPETQNFWVLFYRKDILDSLKLPVPDTWDDVVNMLPELQRLGMNFFEPNAASGGFKTFTTTTPFIYQFGGELYAEDGMSTAIDSEKALKGINFMTELYTTYNIPQSVPNFYHHFRYGTMPIGISDFQTYIQLRTAAPEIANEWKLALHPGVKQGDEVVRWAPGGGTAAMIMNGTPKPEQSWSFLKWWMSADTQVAFANLLQTTYGETYMWNTANIEAFKQLPWPEEDKSVILDQFNWIREPSRVPGGYMLEREISNVWNRVVFNGDNPRTTIDDSVIRIDREIKKKMEEFDYIKKGQILKPYPVPTITTINKWVER
jgi:ABC-type glycerol-3-phosphate transport system substrate-binding protein